MTFASETSGRIFLKGASRSALTGCLARAHPTVGFSHRPEVAALKVGVILQLGLKVTEIPICDGVGHYQRPIPVDLRARRSRKVNM